MTYAMLIDAAATVSDMPDPNALGRPDALGNNFPFKLILFEYDKMKNDAVSNGLIHISNNQLSDISGANATPYEVKTLIAGAPWFTGQLQSNESYTFTMNLASNMATDIQGIEVDWGTGYVPFNQGQSITITPGNTLQIDFTLKVKLNDGQLLYTNSQLSVEEQIAAITPDGYSFAAHFTIPIDPTQTPNVFDGDSDIMTIVTACNDNMVRRPLLMINGFEAPRLQNFFGIDFEDAFFGLFENSPTGNRIITELLRSGYDIIFLDFKDETLSMEENAEVVKAAIRMINNMKITDEEIVSIGLSMGGVLGKLALREMELTGEDHQTKQFFSFDSPLRGANMPLGFQAMVFDMHGLNIGPLGVGPELGNIVTVLDDAVRTVRRPSPRQMLIYRYDEVEPGTPPSPYNHRGFYDYFSSLDALEHCEHIAISNGSQIGNGQNYSDGDIIMHIKATAGEALQDISNSPFLSSPITTTLIDIFGNIILGTGGFANFKVYAIPDGELGRVYKGFVFAQVFGIPVAFHSRKVKVDNGQPVDNAPGGMADLPFGFLNIVEHLEQRFCFIPTVSALEVGPFKGLTAPYGDPFEDISNNDAVLTLAETSMQGIVAIDDPMVFTAADGEVFDNTDHVDFTLDNSGVLLGEIKNGPTLFTSQDNRIFNFGDSELAFNYMTPPITWTEFRTEPIIDSDIDITGTGKIWVNGSDRIGFIDELNQLNSTDSHYEVKITSSYCDGFPTTVTIENGGLMEVGDWNDVFNTGEVNIYDNATLQIGVQGEALVHHLSELNIKDGGSLEIEANGLAIAQFGAKITIENGGTLRVKNNGTLRISQYSELEIEAGGLLIIEDDAQIQLWDGLDPDGAAVIRVKGTLQVEGEIDFTGNGYFQFHPGNNLMIPNGRFALQGKGQEHRFIEILAGTHMNVGGAELRLRTGKVVYHDNSSIDVETGGSVTLSSTRHEGSDTATGISGEGLNRLTVSATQFSGLGVGLELIDLQTPAISVYNMVNSCQFYGCDVGIQLDGANQFFVSQSEFEFGINAILSNDVNTLRLNSCVVKSYVDPSPSTLEDWGAIYLMETPEFVVSNTEITNNDVGVFAPLYNLYGGENHVNVILRNKTEISNHSQHGVFITKGGIDNNGLDYGLVLMDCAKLLDNQVGIGGTDVLFQIDAIENSGTSNPTYWRSNTFRNLQNGILFGICYDERDDVTQVSAQGNFWDHPNIAANIHNLHNLQSNNNPTGCVGYTPSVAIDVSNFVNQLPSSCPGPPPGGGDYPMEKECELSVSGLTEKIGKMYRSAYSNYNQLLNEDKSTALAKALFEDIATIPNGVRENAAAECRKFIDVSRVLAIGDYQSYSGTQNLQSNGGKRPELLESSRQEWQKTLEVFPNPATSEINIQSSEAIMRIKLTDAIGKVIYEEKAEQADVHINIDFLSRGVYFLYVELENNTLQQRKLVVQ